MAPSRPRQNARQPAAGLSRRYSAGWCTSIPSLLIPFMGHLSSNECRGKTDMTSRISAVRWWTSRLSPLVLAVFLLQLSLFAEGFAYAPAAGTHQVAIWRGAWHEASRNRSIPVKIYYPADL